MNVSEYFASLMGYYGRPFPKNIFLHWVSHNDPGMRSVRGYFNNGGLPDICLSIINSVIICVVCMLLLITFIVIVLSGYGQQLVTTINNVNPFFVIVLCILTLRTVYVVVVYVSFSKMLKSFCKEKEEIEKQCFIPGDSIEGFQEEFECAQVSIARRKILIQTGPQSEFSLSEEIQYHNRMKKLDGMAKRFGLVCREWSIYFERAKAQLQAECSGEIDKTSNPPDGVQTC